MVNVQSTWDFVMQLESALAARRSTMPIGPVVDAKATSTTGVIVIEERVLFIELCFEARDSDVDCYLIRRRANGWGSPESWQQRVCDDILNKDKIRIYAPTPGWPEGRRAYRELVKKTVPELVQFAITQYEAAMARIPDEWRS
jgi:hypothetical protein